MKSERDLRHDSECNLNKSTDISLFSQGRQTYRPLANCLPRHLLVCFLLLTFPTLELTLLPSSSKLHAGTLIYTIEEGDTLESIALRFKTSTAALMEINHFRNIEQAQQNIVRGQSILIPPPDIVLASVGSRGIENTDTLALDSSESPKPRYDPKDPIRLGQANPLARPQAQIQSPSQRSGQTSNQSQQQGDLATSHLGGSRLEQEYQVHAGDTLSSLALQFHSSSAQLRTINGLDSDKIRIGQTLLVPNNNADDQPQANPNHPLNLSATTSFNSQVTDTSTENNLQENLYTVQKGDTLLGISRKTKVNIGVIRTLNQLEEDFIRPGQVLRISSPDQTVNTVAKNRQGNLDKPSNTDENRQLYRIAKGDTLMSISRKFGISLSQLLQWNNLQDADKLSIGQSLIVSAQASLAKSNPNTLDQTLMKYTVETGDTLWSISQRFNLSVAELHRYNPGLDELLRPAQILVVPQQNTGSSNPAENIGTNLQLPANKAEPIAANTEPNSDGVLAQPPPNAYQSKEQEEVEIRTNDEKKAYQQLEIRKRQKVKVTPPASLPQAPEDQGRPIDLKAYFTHNAPRVPRQPNASYYEEFTDDPLENYQTARQLLAKFDKEIEAMPQLSHDLKGYFILIDPGHGGLDPGFNSQSEDGNGDPLYIIEDEYNYDYALRLYRQLKRNGAQVGLTILSPNQRIVDSPDASRTLVSQKNEVYNSPFINQRGEYSSWPSGTPSGLHKRIEVAESFFNGTAKNKRIFISLHNDNSPWDNDGRLVLHYNDSLTIDKLGMQLAEFLVPYLGKDAHQRGQNLAVLRQNPARYAVLVELRNIAYPRNSWAIRDANLREEDIQMLTNGILAFVQSLKN